ncbi:zf-Tim10_DDP domain-containing protein [Meloidogyne graminicola]|uniref:Mitochondrial import inner membrane translocase subunit n=1 Tax=Meloidogyne graminicola TaxID=189291 RepID=A0A8T0A166_9BILA|nr:zf-Tim10_DDP domain-containing protein [Meloidogyne graminicola]
MANNAAQAQALQAVADLEIEMMTDTYRRMTQSCQSKCINTSYREPELLKGEAVCLDRCLSKYLDVHDRLGKLLMNMTQQDDKALQQQQQQNLAASARKMHGK